MRRRLGVLALLALASCSGPGESPETRPRPRAELVVLDASTDRVELERAAAALAASGRPADLAELSARLASPGFLARLDDLDTPSVKTRHLGVVLGALTENPGPATAELCLTLGRSSAFLADPDRKTFLLPALAAVRPMSAEAAGFFQEAVAEGYYSTVAPLLTENGSHAALELFVTMIEDQSVDAETRVDALHHSVLPRRADTAVLDACDRLLSAGLEEAVTLGVVESVFDHRHGEWFGKAAVAPAPPDWEDASDEALESVLRLAGRAGRPLPPALQSAVEETVATVRAILAGREE